MAARGNKYTALLKAASATCVVFCTTFQSPQVACCGFVHPERDAVLKRERRQKERLRDKNTQQRAWRSARRDLEPKMAQGEKPPGELRGSRPAGPFHRFLPSSLRGKCHAPPSSGFLRGKCASRCLIFWRHLCAHICPIPRKQTLPYIRIKSASPPPAEFTGIFRRTARSFPVWLV